MSGLWPHWLRPYWLLSLPLLIWLLWRLWHRQRRVGRWQALLPPAFHAVLLSGSSGARGRLRWVILGLAWTLALLALIGPSWQRVEQPNYKPVAPLVVILDLTPRMLATDAAPTRLEQARRKVLDLLQARRDAQTAIVVFAGSAHTLVPLSDDLATARNLLEALKPSIMPEPGQRADLAVDKALALLAQGAQGQGQLLLIGSNLDEQERRGIRKALGSHGERLRILGMGSPEGAPIAAEAGGFLKDEQGAILMPRLDQAGLQHFADELGGRYSRVRLDDQDLRDLGLLEDMQQMRDSGEPTLLAIWADQGYWLLLPLLLLAACAGRRGWLFCLPLLLAVPQPSQAFELNDLWLRRDQQGQRLLEAQQPAAAAERFSDPQWQGLALYQAGDYAAAADRFARSDSAAGHYNRGNALARSEQLEAALDAYEQALERQPDLQPALDNKALIEQLLKQREQQQQQQNPAEQPGDSQQSDDQQSAPSDTQDSPQGEAHGGQNTDSQSPAAAEPQAAEQPATPSSTAPADTPDTKNAQRPDDATEHTAETAETAQADAAAQGLGEERRQALEQWLRQIPDEPGELLRRKFWYEQQQRQEQNR